MQACTFTKASLEDRSDVLSLKVHPTPAALQLVASLTDIEHVNVSVVELAGGILSWRSPLSRPEQALDAQKLNVTSSEAILLAGYGIRVSRVFRSQNKIEHETHGGRSSLDVEDVALFEQEARQLRQ